jgi:hypothetical protein
MFLRNTSPYPDEEVRALVKLAARDYDLRYVCVNVKGSKTVGYAGYAYRTVPRAYSNAPRTAKRLVTIRVGLASHFPSTRSQPYGGKRSPLMTYHDWREALVAVAAHEFHHILQFQNKMPCAEYRCELAAQRALERYREQQAI